MKIINYILLLSVFISCGEKESNSEITEENIGYNFELTQKSATGTFEVTATPSTTIYKVGVPLDLSISTLNNETFEITGLNPDSVFHEDHGHGLATAPSVAENTIIKDIGFTMPGIWSVSFNIKTTEQEESVKFYFRVLPGDLVPNKELGHDSGDSNTHMHSDQ